MAAKIGVLGETTTITAGTITVYTVPASKAAKVRLQWYISAPNTCRCVLNVNGQAVFGDTAGGAEFSGSRSRKRGETAAVFQQLGTGDRRLGCKDRNGSRDRCTDCPKSFSDHEMGCTKSQPS